MQTLLTTAGNGSSDAFKEWREAICDQFAPISLTKFGDWPFVGHLEASSIANIPVTRLIQTASRAEISPNDARRSQKSDFLSIALKIRGRSYSSQYDRTAVQNAGDIVLFDYRPAVFDSKTQTESLFFEVPRSRLENILGPSRLYTSLTLEAGQPSTSLVTEFLCNLVRVHQSLAPDTAERMSSIGIDLLVASIADRLAQAIPGTMHATILMQRAKAYVESHLGDSSLDPPHLAAAMGVSLRRLQEVFKDHGKHISDWIWQRRLETAAKYLFDPGYDHVPISILGYGCGFSTPAHFSRRFKQYFDLTPTEFRIKSAQQTRL